MENKRIHIIITGRVQGVFFRDFTCRHAQSLKLTGWVRNLIDGRVEITAEGERHKIESFLDVVKTGPESARVDDCQIEWQDYTGEFKSFEIVYSSY